MSVFVLQVHSINEIEELQLQLQLLKILASFVLPCITLVSLNCYFDIIDDNFKQLCTTWFCHCWHFCIVGYFFAFHYVYSLYIRLILPFCVQSNCLYTVLLSLLLLVNACYALVFSVLECKPVPYLFKVHVMLSRCRAYSPSVLNQRPTVDRTDWDPSQLY